MCERCESSPAVEVVPLVACAAPVVVRGPVVGLVVGVLGLLVVEARGLLVVTRLGVKGGSLRMGAEVKHCGARETKIPATGAADGGARNACNPCASASAQGFVILPASRLSPAGTYIILLRCLKICRFLSPHNPPPREKRARCRARWEEGVCMFLCVCRAGCHIISASVHLLTFFCSSESSGVTGDGEDSGEIYARRGGGRHGE